MPRRAFIEIHEKSSSAPGYLVTGNYPYLVGFSWVEDSQTDFSTTADMVREYLDLNYPDDAPHKPTFHPEDRTRWTQFHVIEVSWEKRPQ